MGVTIRDVAREAGVSPATVSRAFNRRDLVNSDTCDHILAVAQRLQYMPNASARSLSTRRSRVLGLILPLPYNEFFAEIMHGAVEAALEVDYNLLIATSHNDADATRSGIRMMSGHVDAFLIVAPNMDMNLLEDAVPAETTAVYLHSPAPHENQYSVGITNREGACEAVRHLLRLGHRRIAAVKGPDVNLEAHERLDGYRQALEEAGVTPDPRLEIPGQFTYESGVAAAKVLLDMDPRPTAVFAFNDYMAIGLMRTLVAAGLSVPGDIAIMGFDNIPSSRYTQPPLSTVHAPGREMSREAVNMLLKAIEHPEQWTPRTQTLETKPILRASTLGSRYEAGQEDLLS